MVRSAFLPDPQTLGNLFAQLRAPVAAKPAEPASTRRRSSRPAPPPEPSTPRPSSAPPQVSSPPAAASSVPPAAEPLGEALLLNELEGQLRGVSSLERGFASLATWLELRTGAQAVFVADSEGLGMTGPANDEPYLAAAGEIGAVLEKLTAIVPGVNEGAVTFELAEGQHLVLVGCMTEFGRISVGLVINRPLEPVWGVVIKKALREVALRGKTTT